MQFWWIVFALFNGLIVWLSIILFWQFVLRLSIPSRWHLLQQRMTVQLQEEVSSLIRSSEFCEFDLENEVSPLLDQRLNRLVEQLKKQVPMGEFFLSGAFVERLKERAKEEILQVLPEIKERLLAKGEKEFYQIIDKRLSDLTSEKFVNFIRCTFRVDFIKIQIVGAVAGFLLGVVETLLFYKLWL